MFKPFRDSRRPDSSLVPPIARSELPPLHERRHHLQPIPFLPAHPQFHSLSSLGGSPEKRTILLCGNRTLSLCGDTTTRRLATSCQTMYTAAGGKAS